MIFASTFLKICSLVANFLSLTIPMIDNVARKFRIGVHCKLCSNPKPETVPYATRSLRRKSATQANGTECEGSEVKRIKLLLDITVSEQGSRVLDIKARPSQHDDETSTKMCGKYCKLCKGKCDQNLWFFLKPFNWPSSVVLYSTSILRQWVDDHNIHSENNGCSDRVKKSPKRRILRSNYRKILPFFPFNLLGFSNYSAFQMPTITTSEETSNLNVSVNKNGKARCKRRRHSSTEEDALSLSSDNETNQVTFEETCPVRNGVDEVDSDETADTVTKQISSSSSCEPSTTENGSCTKKFVILSESEICESTTTSDKPNFDINDAVGDEIHIVSTFMEELDEAANESYNSQDDPDYKPSESSTESSSSFITNSGESDGSFTASISIAEVIESAISAVHDDGQFPTISTGACEDDYKTPEEEEPDRPFN